MASVTDGQVEAAKRRLRTYARGRAGDWTRAVREAVEAALAVGEAGAGVTSGGGPDPTRPGGDTRPKLLPSRAGTTLSPAVTAQMRPCAFVGSADAEPATLTSGRAFDGLPPPSQVAGRMALAGGPVTEAGKRAEARRVAAQRMAAFVRR